MTRLLVLGQAEDAVVEWTVHPLLAFRRQIKKQLDVDVEHVVTRGFEDVERALDTHRADVAFVTTSWRESADETTAFLRRLYDRPQRPRLVYLDTFDPTSSPFFGALPYVDSYVKKQLLRDLDRYRAVPRGGMEFSDFMARERGHDLGSWHFGSVPPEGYADRLVLGWNLGTARQLRRGMRKIVRSQAERDIDVHCRVSFGPEPGSWYAAHRQAVLDALVPLGARHQVVAAGGDAARVPLDVFQDEMARARIGFSPYGWGEVTDRDFHIVNHGALLMKPDMGHLVTEPDIYRDGETYVAVRWDLADVEDKVGHYLAHPAEAQRIADRAREVYREYFADGFLASLRRVLA